MQAVHSEHSVQKSKKRGQIALHVFFILVSLCYILPLILMVSVSFTEENAIVSGGFSLVPQPFSTEAYQLAFRNPKQLIDSYKVTTIVSFAGMALHVFVMSIMAYSLSRRNFALRRVFTFLAFFTMLFNGGIVPTYLLITKYLQLKNTYWVYILPSVASAWNLIVLRTNFQQLPDALVESAKIDGASEYRICFSIVLPLSVPAMATIGFLYFVGKWNDWTTCVYYINKPYLYSLQYLLQRILREAEFLKQLSAEQAALEAGAQIPTESFRFAMAVLAAGPVLVIFPFFQKYFSKGLTIGAVKG
ncbi:MAG: carbohydrate ABC transporter permease [Clostridiales bacterium]|nr:carbohydrate ABC transporter permease [Clostridiales bacterium]